MKKTMLDYIRETPDVLTGMLEKSQALTGPLGPLLRDRPFRILRIVASGSSGNAAWCARPMLRRLLEAEVLVTPPHTFVHYEHELREDEVVLTVSQSGYSTNALEALDVIRAAGGRAVGITADPDSEMKEHCRLLVDYGAGAEEVGYVTKGVSALVLFFSLAAVEWGGAAEPLRRRARGALAATVSGNRRCAELAGPFLERHYMDLSSMGTVFLCGSGACYGAALEGALKLCETLQIPAAAYETEEYLHGPELQLTPNHTVFFLDDGGGASRRTRELWQATCQVTRRSYLLTCGAEPPQDPRVLALEDPGMPEAAPLCMLPFFQTAAYRLTEDKHLWHKHPLCARLEHTVSGKSARYVHKEVL